MKITEQNFIKQIIQGNEKALEYCMLHYGGLVKTVVRRHLGDLSRFEDECINDVFFAVWQHADSYRSDKNSRCIQAESTGLPAQVCEASAGSEF